MDDMKEVVLATIFALVVLMIFVPHDSRASESGSMDSCHQNIIDRN